MEKADSRDHNTAEQQLNPTRIGNLVRHLVGDHHRTQRIDHRRDCIESQQVGKAMGPGDIKLSAKEHHP